MGYLIVIVLYLEVVDVAPKHYNSSAFLTYPTKTFLFSLKNNYKGKSQIIDFIQSKQLENKPLIVHLIRKTKGGIQTHVVDAVSFLNRKRYGVAVISSRNEALSSQLRLINVPHYEIEISDKLSPMDLLTVMRLARCLKNLSPDILHIHGNKTALVGVPAASLANIPATVVTVHNYLVYDSACSSVKAVAGIVERRLAKRIDKFIAVSESIKRGLLEVERLKPAQITVIHNGIDLSRWRDLQPPDSKLRSELGFGRDDVVIASVGRLVEFKGHEVLIRAVGRAASKSKVRVLIVGDGPLRLELQNLIDDLDLNKNVSLLGYLSDVRPVLAMSDLFVLPSLKEPFGLVLLEAQAAGLPVIATESGGVVEFIEDGKNGILVPPGDAEALSKTIDNLAMNESRRSELANAGRMVVNKFSVDRFVTDTEAVYDELLKKTTVVCHDSAETTNK